MTPTVFKIFLILVVGAIYLPSVQFGFSQDDWYFLLLSQAENWQDILSFFNPHAQSGFPFFRPLGTQLYYYVFVTLFGLTLAPYFMHLFMLAIQILSAYLVFRLLVSLKQTPLTAQLTALAYAGASSLFLSLYYIAATQQLLATFFSLLALNLSLNRRNLAAGVIWGLALLSKETALMTPVIMLLLTHFFAGVTKLAELSRRSVPYVVVGLGYLALRLTAPLTVQSEYHLAFGANVLSTLRWFFLFAYGAPEAWISYATVGGGVDLVAFVRDHGVLAFLNTSLVLGLSAYALLLILRSFRQRLPYLYLAWWLIGLLPVLFLQNHRYPHYLDLSLIPLLLLLLGQTKAKKLLTWLLLLASASSVYLSLSLHWTIGRAEISRRAITYFAEQDLCRSNLLRFIAPPPYPAELSYALSLENGPRVICNNAALKVEYTSDPDANQEGLSVDPRLILNP